MANFRVTYATLSADNEELHAAFEEGVVGDGGGAGAGEGGDVGLEPGAGFVVGEVDRHRVLDP